MEKSELIAIAFSDLHINLWSKFNREDKRTLDNFRVLFVIRDICKEHKVPALFCGDMFNKGEIIENHLLTLTIKKTHELGNGWECFGISGNHDSDRVRTIGKENIDSMLKNLADISQWLKCIDFSKRPIIIKNKLVAMVYGIPYIDHNINLNKYIKDLDISKSVPNILLLHTDYPGAKDTDGRKIDSVENLNINTLKKFDLVLCGHIHKHQRLSKKVYMVGAPIQMRRTDKNCKMGYWEIYSDMSLKFVELEGFPKFIDVENREDIKDDGNYYTVIPKKEEKPVKQDNKIHRNLSKDKLARKYMREKGIKDREKLNLLRKVLKKSQND